MQTDLPTEHDFDPYGGDLDAQYAWKNFGGLTVEQAMDQFAENPEHYHEDFMHMGGRAFAYYYPVIDRFIREATSVPEDERGDRLSWIIPQCISYQFEGKNRLYVQHLAKQVLQLCDFVLASMEYFRDDWDPPEEIEAQWRQLRHQVRNRTS